MGPTSLLAATRGAVAAGLVAHWSGPQASSQAQYFSNILEEIILDFQDHRRTFIFGVFFLRDAKTENRKN